MNKKNKLLMFMLLIIGIANAQGSKEDFENAVNYCACKIAYAYTNQYAEKNPNSDEGKSFEKTIKSKIENCNIISSISKSDLLELLDKNYFSTFSKELATVINKIQKSFQESLTKKEAINNIIDGFYKNSEFKRIITTYTDIGNIKNDLKKELNNSLNSFKVEKMQPVKPKNNTGKERKSEIEQLKNLINSKKEILPNWLSISLILSLFSLFLFLLFLIFKKNSSINNRLDKYRDDIEKLKSNNSFNSKNITNSEFERTINRKIFELNDSISKIQNDIGNFSLNQNQKAVSIPNPIQRQEEKKQEILFAPAPDKDGSFNISVVVSSENQSSSFYKFTLLDDQKAKFKFINSERAIRDAVSSYEMILEPVCTFKNALNQNAKRIITTKEGIVIKQNDKWILDTKAEITYE